MNNRIKLYGYILRMNENRIPEKDWSVKLRGKLQPES
jgi:hypothetical protein